MLRESKGKELDIFKEGFLTKENYRQKVTEAEEFLLSLPQLDIPVKQHFAPGVYTREITIPKHAVLTGSLHKHDHVVVVSKGSILVATDEGLKKVEAPDSFIAPAGVKRIAICLEECRWMTVHSYFGEPLPEDQMKQVIGCDTYKDYDIWIAQKDFERFVSETGLRDIDIKVIVADEADIVKTCPVPAEVDVSPISGFGMFATKDIQEGETVGPATVEGFRTILGRFVNHSPSPNMIGGDVDGDFHFVANKNIPKGEEILVNYRQVNSLRRKT